MAMITVQCHDNPDVDSLCSMFLMHILNPASELIYFGSITKPNIKNTLDYFENKLKVKVIANPENYSADILIVVDAQYGESNVTQIPCKSLLVVDHHHRKGDPFPKQIIEPQHCSCTSLIFKEFFTEELISGEHGQIISNLVYNGMYTDTNKFSKPSMCDYDKELKESLETDMDSTYRADEALIFKLNKDNISRDNLPTLLSSLNRYTIVDPPYDNIVIVGASCDDNTLGLVSDMFAEVEGIDIVISYSKRNDKIYKASIRSYNKFFDALDIISHLTQNNIGSGGGHSHMAGGILFIDKIGSIHSYLERAIIELINSHNLIESGKICNLPTFPTSKKAYSVRVIEKRLLTDNDKQNIKIQTSEGEISTSRAQYFILGVKGEIYPISKEELEDNYIKINDQKFLTTCEQYLADKEYNLTINVGKEPIHFTGKNLRLFPAYLSKASAEERMLHKLERPCRVITKWSDISPSKGKIGDYLCIKDNGDNIYIIEEEIARMTYNV